MREKGEQLAIRIDNKVNERSTLRTAETRWGKFRATINKKEATEILEHKADIDLRKPWIKTDMIEKMDERGKWK